MVVWCVYGHWARLAKVVGTADIITGRGPINLLLGPLQGARLASAGYVAHTVKRRVNVGSAFPAAKSTTRRYCGL